MFSLCDMLVVHDVAFPRFHSRTEIRISRNRAITHVGPYSKTNEYKFAYFQCGGIREMDQSRTITRVLLYLYMLVRMVYYMVFGALIYWLFSRVGIINNFQGGIYYVLNNSS